MRKVFGSGQLLLEIWEYFTLKRASARKIVADAAQEKQEGIQGQWQQTSPFKEVVEQVQRSVDTDCNAQMMRRACNAMKLGNWESFKKECRKEGQLCGCFGGYWTLEHCAGHFEIEHGLLEKDHRSSRRNGRTCPVLRLPALQLLPSG